MKYFSKDLEVIKECEEIGTKWINFSGSIMSEIQLFRDMRTQYYHILDRIAEDTEIRNATREFVFSKIKWCSRMLYELKEML